MNKKIYSHNGKTFDSEAHYFESIIKNGDTRKEVLRATAQYYYKQCKRLIDLNFETAKRLNAWEKPIREIIAQVIEEET